VGRYALLKSRIVALVLALAAATVAPCLELTGGVHAGAGGSLFYGGWVHDERDELYGLGATTVTDRIYLSWRAGGWIEIPVLERLSIRVEPSLGPVGGALLASDGYDMLVGVTAIELTVPVLAVTRIGMPVGEIVLGAGIFLGGAISVRQIQNDGAIRSEGELASVLGCAGLAGGAGYVVPIGPGAITADLRVLASLLSITSPWRDRMLNAVSIELTAGWQFRPREIRSRGTK
jgi:hypothetical protein